MVLCLNHECRGSASTDRASRCSKWQACSRCELAEQNVTIVWWKLQRQFAHSICWHGSLPSSHGPEHMHVADRALLHLQTLSSQAAASVRLAGLSPHAWSAGSSVKNVGCMLSQAELLHTIAVSNAERTQRARHGTHPRDHTETAVDEARRVRPRRE